MVVQPDDDDPELAPGPNGRIPLYAMSARKRLGAALKAILTEKGLNQKTAAPVLGLGQPRISEILSPKEGKSASCSGSNARSA